MPGGGKSLLDEITVAAVELRLRSKLDEIRIEEIRYHLEDETGVTTSEKMELSASTMALRFESLSAEVKEVVEASERARVMATRAFKIIAGAASIGGRAQQSRLVRRMKAIGENGDINEIHRVHQAVQIIMDEYGNNALHRTKSIQDRLELSTIRTDRGGSFLDEIVSFSAQHLKLIGALWTAEYAEGDERVTARKAGSPAQKRATRQLLRKIRNTVARTHGARLSEAMEMERQATQVAGDLADAEVEQVLECIEKYASDKITRLAIINRSFFRQDGCTLSRH